MKKNLFKKFLAVFLTGTMLAGVGCKDYDDDIDKLNNRVDGLEGQIALKADKTALDDVYKRLEGIDLSNMVTNDALNKKLEGYAQKDALKDFLNSQQVLDLLKQKGYETAAVIKASLDLLNTADVKAVFDEMMYANKALGELQPAIQNAIEDALKEAGFMQGTSALSESQVNQLLTAVAQAVNAESTNVKDAVDKLLGANFASYMATYMSVPAQMAQLGSNVSAEIAKQLSENDVTLQKAIQDMIDASIAGAEKPDLSVYVKTEDLQTSFAAYDKQIDAIWSVLGVLVDRIQSVVYVPENKNGFAMFRSYMAGNTPLSTAKTAEMTFRITPSSIDIDALIAARITDENPEGTVIIDLRNEVEVDRYTRAAAPYVKVVDVKAGANAGEIVVVAESTYDYDDGYSSKMPAISLYIEQKSSVKAEDGETDSSISSSIASNYIPTEGNEAEDVIYNFVMAKPKAATPAAAETPIEYEEATYTECELIWNDPTQACTSQQGYKLMYKDGDCCNEDATYYTLEEAKAKFHWDVLPELYFEHNSVKWAGSDDLTTLKHLVLNPAKDFTTANKNKPINVKVTDKEADRLTSNIYKELVIADDMYIKIGSKKEQLTAPFSTVVRLVRPELAKVQLPAQEITWSHKNYVANATTGYEIQMVQLPAGKLTAEQFKALDFATLGEGWTVKKADGSKVNDGITVSAERIGEPMTDTDAQLIKLTIKNYKNGDGEITYTNKFNVNDESDVTLTGTIAFNGLPNMAYVVETPEKVTYSVAGDNIVAPLTDKFDKDMYAKFIAANKDQKFFADQADFSAFIASLTDSKLTAQDADAEAKPMVAGAALEIVSGSDNKALNVNFVKADVNFPKQASYTYEVAKNDYIGLDDIGFKIVLSGSLTISNDNSWSLMRAEGLRELADGTLYMPATGTADVTAKTFQVGNVKVYTAYQAVKANENVTSTATVTYSVIGVPASYNHKPTITDESAEAILDWKKCGLDQVTVQAAMSVDGIVVDIKTFPVILEKPIDFTFGQTSDKLLTKEVKVGTAEVKVNIYKELNALKDAKQKPLISDIWKNALLSDTYVSDFANDPNAYGLAADVKVEYKGAGGAVVSERFSDTNGEITVAAGDNIPAAVTATATITFTYDYAEVSDGKTPPAFKKEEYKKTVVINFVPEK